MISDADLARRHTRYEVMKRVFILATFVLVTICLVILISLGRLLVSLAQENHQTLATIKDCTQPTGACHQRGQRDTARAVASINRVVILAAACASGLPPHISVAERQSETQQCVISRLALHSR